MHAESLSRIQLFVTPWTIDHHAPLSMRSPGKNTRLGSHSPFQGIFSTRVSNLRLLHCSSLPSEPPGKPRWILRVRNPRYQKWTIKEENKVEAAGLLMT